MSLKNKSWEDSQRQPSLGWLRKVTSNVCGELLSPTDRLFCISNQRGNIHERNSLVLWWQITNSTVLGMGQGVVGTMAFWNGCANSKRSSSTWFTWAFWHSAPLSNRCLCLAFSKELFTPWCPINMSGSLWASLGHHSLCQPQPISATICFTWGRWSQQPGKYVFLQAPCLEGLAGTDLQYDFWLSHIAGEGHQKDISKHL